MRRRLYAFIFLAYQILRRGIVVLTQNQVFKSYPIFKYFRRFLRCMNIPVNNRRVLIERLFEDKDFAALDSLEGIQLLPDETDEANDRDCVGYVLMELRAPDAAIDTILGGKRESLAKPGRKYVVIYSTDTMQHVGIYENLWVHSKWGRHDPVIKHRLIDVPLSYGNHVEFIEISDALLSRIQYVKMSR